MQGNIFNPADWIYVPDGMGRLGKGYYKNKANPSQTLTVAAFESKRAETPVAGPQEYEQNINKFTKADGGVRLSTGEGASQEKGGTTLSPWDNPVYGEQSSAARQRSVVTQKEAKPQGQGKTFAQEPVLRPPAPSPHHRENKESNGAESESGAGSEGTVICTELHRRGLMSLGDYRNSHLYARTRLPAPFMRGYQFWAIPYVALMKRSTWAVAFILPFVRWRTTEILHRLGKRSAGSLRGRILCAVHDRLCVLLGTVLGGQTPKVAARPEGSVYG